MRLLRTCASITAWTVYFFLLVAWFSTGCAPPRPTVRILSGPRLVVTGTRVAGLEEGLGGARVRITARIVDGDSEAWHCPVVEATWPDGTTSRHEEDCEPWPAEGPRSWEWRKVYPPGNWVTRVCLAKAGRVLACAKMETAVVGDAE